MKTRICIFLITVIFMLSLAVTSNAEKLFWVDCGPEFDCTNAKLYYVDSSSATPKAVLFDTGVYVHDYDDISDFKRISSIGYSFLTGTLDLITYQITNIKTSYIFYFKGGKIWLVDTTTLAKRRLSNESGITSATLCDYEKFADMMNPNDSSISYRLKGPDGQCDTGDDIYHLVKLGMISTTPPINIPLCKYIHEILLDSRYIVENYCSNPWRLEICSTDLSSCKKITEFTDSTDPENFDKRYIMLIVDCKLMSYDYISDSLCTLYTPASDECVRSDARLDKDGYVYFSNKKYVPPFTTTIYKVPANCGNPVKLGEITTTYVPDEDELETSPTHVVFLWRESSSSAEHVYSFSKGGETPVVINDACINGGIAGQYYFCEDKNGNVNRVNLDGTERIKRSSSQLNGRTYGGSADWFYGINPSTGRVFISDISNNLRSYAINEDFRNPTKGISIGTVPVNLSNFDIFDFGLDMLGIGIRRFTGSSFGTDILFLDATTPSSLKRLTNTNGWKIDLSGD